MSCRGSTFPLYVDNLSHLSSMCVEYHNPCLYWKINSNVTGTDLRPCLSTWWANELRTAHPSVTCLRKIPISIRPEIEGHLKLHTYTNTTKGMNISFVKNIEARVQFCDSVHFLSSVYILWIYWDTCSSLFFPSTFQIIGPMSSKNYLKLKDIIKTASNLNLNMEQSYQSVGLWREL